MITQRMMIKGVKTVPESWQFTINTKATTPGEKKTGIPLNLYGQDGITVTVNWGDGTISTLTSADYEALDASASVHEYATPGIYTVKVISKNWSDLYLHSYIYDIQTVSNSLVHIDLFRKTLIFLDTPIPSFAGMIYRTNSTSTQIYKANLSLYCLFYYCKKLTSITENLLSKNTNFEDFLEAFSHCESLVSIPSALFQDVAVVLAPNTFSYCLSLSGLPENLFAGNENITNFYRCFYECSALGDFSLHIGSEGVSRADEFVSSSSSTTRTIYVPSGSTTETTFNAVASSLGLTVIGE